MFYQRFLASDVRSNFVECPFCSWAMHYLFDNDKPVLELEQKIICQNVLKSLIWDYNEKRSGPGPSACEADLLAAAPFRSRLFKLFKKTIKLFKKLLYSKINYKTT